MNENRNFQQKLDKILADITQSEAVPTLLLHACCAPCSSYVLEYLSRYFAITVYYYNPNISPGEEYEKRVLELKRFIREAYEPADLEDCIHRPIGFMEGTYEPERFFEMAKGMEEEPEGGARCYRCYELRLREAVKAAKAGGFDYVTTTLSISPHKNAAWLNEIGLRLSEEYGVSYLVSDFKKKNGYRRSIELSKEYGLYRQDYCGCVFSKNQFTKKGFQGTMGKIETTKRKQGNEDEKK